MKKIATRAAAALIAAATLTTGMSLGASAATTDSPAAAGDSKVGEIPSIVYGVRITDTDDYIDAVRATAASNDEIRNAENAVNSKATSVDNSQSPYFPEVGNQGSIGSCGAWATVYYQFTYEMNKALGRKTTHENSFNPLFVYNMIGTNPGTCFEMLNEIGGAQYSLVPDELNVSTWNPTFDVWRDAANYRVTSYYEYENVGMKNSRITSVDDPDIAALKATLRNGGLIYYTGFIYSYKYTKLKASSENSEVNKSHVGEQVIYKEIGANGCHAMNIVGYDDNIWTDINENGKIDSGEMGAFKMVNSWGQYANGGFCWIAYDALNEQSVVPGVAEEAERHSATITLLHANVNKDFKSSNIYLKYTLNTSDRTDNYIEISAKRKSDGVTYTRMTNPYIHQGNVYGKTSYDGTAGAADGTMIVDLDNIIRGLNSDNFHDYEWSVKFVDKGGDSAPLTVKNAEVIDERAQKVYKLDASFPFNVNKTSVDVPLKAYYNFNTITMSPASNIQVGKYHRIYFNAENETAGTTPIKYDFIVKSGDTVVYQSKVDAQSTDKTKKSSVIKAVWKPKKKGDYTATLRATDGSGAVAERSVSFKVYISKLTIRSLDFDTGKYIGNYERVKITPQVTGGTGPYTYSYYYQKGKKTYTIVENSKVSYRYRNFGSNDGAYNIIVKVKDANGDTASFSRYLKVEPTTISRIDYSTDIAKPNTYVKVSAKVKNEANVIDKSCYTYTVTKGSSVTTLTTGDDKSAYWLPKEAGKYTVKLTIKYNNKTVAEKASEYDVIAPDENADKIKVNVCIISYVYNETSSYSSSYKLHYWNNAGFTGDAVCEMANKTKDRSVGSEYWNGSNQHFYVYTAYVPKNATGFKFHIGDRWFGGDGSLSTSNTVYVFNYSGDKAMYTKE